MRYLTGGEVAAALANLVHQETQQHEYETDLTVGGVFQLTGPGALDFGGLEYEQAGREALEPVKAPPDDKPPVSALVRLDSDRAGSDVGTLDKSLAKAANPCWVPLIKSGPRAVVALSGGKNPNAVGTSAGPVEKPKAGSP